MHKTQKEGESTNHRPVFGPEERTTSHNGNSRCRKNYSANSVGRAPPGIRLALIQIKTHELRPKNKNKGKDTQMEKKSPYTMRLPYWVCGY